MFSPLPGMRTAQAGLIGWCRIYRLPSELYPSTDGRPGRIYCRCGPTLITAFQRLCTLSVPTSVAQCQSCGLGITGQFKLPRLFSLLMRLQKGAACCCVHHWPQPGFISTARSVKYISHTDKKYISPLKDHRKRSYCVVVVARTITVSGYLLRSPFAKAPAQS